MAIEDTLINGVFMIIIFFVGSWIYTKFIMKYIVRDEIKKIIKDLSDALKNDGETKERVREIIDAIMDEVTKKIKEAFANYDINSLPSAIRKFIEEK